MSNETKGLARSVQIRLVTHSKSLGVDTNLILTRYTIDLLWLGFSA